MSIHPMREGKTAAQLAKELGVNIKTVYKYTAEPRADYEAKSINRNKPWEYFGISRATWYRRGKPNPTAENSEGRKAGRSL